MSNKPTPVIVDCDPGRDDTWSIVALLKSEARFNIKVIAITIVNGNTTVDHSSRNALLVLEKLNRLDVPVFIGADNSLIRKPVIFKYHGDDGLFNIFTEKPSADLVQKKHAVSTLEELIEKYPGEIVLFAIGPLTNVALLYKMHYGISEKLKKLVIMGGNYKGVGNVREVSNSAEFNFWCDPEAAYIVLEETRCELMILPWETCKESCEKTTMDWRLNVLSNGSVVTNFLDPLDKNAFATFILCDAYAIACFLLPTMVLKSRTCNVTVETGGNLTRGQMVLDHRGLVEHPVATIVEKIDVELFKRFLMWICDHKDVEL